MKINKKKRIKSKMSIESIVVAMNLRRLTKDDLTNPQKLNEACIRLKADLAFIYPKVKKENMNMIALRILNRIPKNKMSFPKCLIQKKKL